MAIHICLSADCDTFDYETVKERLDFFTSNVTDGVYLYCNANLSGANLFQKWANENGHEITMFSGDKTKYGVYDNRLTNTMMVQCTTHCVIFGNGYSLINDDLIMKAHHANLKIKVVNNKK